MLEQSTPFNVHKGIVYLFIFKDALKKRNIASKNMRKKNPPNLDWKMFFPSIGYPFNIILRSFMYFLFYKLRKWSITLIIY